MRKKDILLFVITWVDLEGIKLSEISQKERDKSCDFTHMWTVNQPANQPNSGRTGYPKGRGWKTGEVGEKGVKCMVMDVNHKILL